MRAMILTPAWLSASTTRSRSSPSMQPLQLASTLRQGTVRLTHWNLAPVISPTSRAVDSGYPIRYAPMPYSGLAAAGTGTRTGAWAGDPVDGVVWAMPTDG